MPCFDVMSTMLSARQIYFTSQVKERNKNTRQATADRADRHRDHRAIIITQIFGERRFNGISGGRGSRGCVRLLERESVALLAQKLELLPFLLPEGHFLVQFLPKTRHLRPEFLGALVKNRSAGILYISRRATLPSRDAGNERVRERPI